jgi:hypothetical protein
VEHLIFLTWGAEQHYVVIPFKQSTIFVNIKWVYPLTVSTIYISNRSTKHNILGILTCVIYREDTKTILLYIIAKEEFFDDAKDGLTWMRS